MAFDDHGPVTCCVSNGQIRPGRPAAPSRRDSNLPVCCFCITAAISRCCSLLFSVFALCLLLSALFCFRRFSLALRRLRASAHIKMAPVRVVKRLREAFKGNIFQGNIPNVGTSTICPAHTSGAPKPPCATSPLKATVHAQVVQAEETAINHGIKKVRFGLDVPSVA